MSYICHKTFLSYAILYVIFLDVKKGLWQDLFMGSFPMNSIAILPPYYPLQLLMPNTLVSEQEEKTALTQGWNGPWNIPGMWPFPGERGWEQGCPSPGMSLEALCFSAWQFIPKWLWYLRIKSPPVCLLNCVVRGWTDDSQSCLFIGSWGEKKARTGGMFPWLQHTCPCPGPL